MYVWVVVIAESPSRRDFCFFRRSASSRAPEAPAQTEQNLFDFVQRFRQDNDYIYRDRLRANLLAKQNVLEVAIEHVALWNQNLAQTLVEQPGDILPLVSAIVASMSSIPPKHAEIEFRTSASLVYLTVRISRQACCSFHPLPSQC